ncbi:3',5'-cyclic-nucleotide phosphodiesterase [Aquabacterium lacunae]|uniref:3',5'-cyclic-nucleotide phosphodiesterase n=1 Tax=Aquabacterium lacunae TaxID=2528630 RepID=A0A4Q9GYZ1_9BURK|nr:3',5'-cyclic-nucleotide phosphodiesterase [Aquabacterium lacunae]TBO31254.1 3',5'-cyclic-nucleotide phosphodiesterase [Aquabacterium lacunae]
MIRVLGCHGSIAARCHTTSFLLDDDILIDAGSGVGELRLDELARIDHILLSHSHLDHILSVPLLADSVIRLRMGGKGLADLRPICIHALPETLKALQQHIFNGVIWPDFTRLPTAAHPILTLREIHVGDVLNFKARGGCPDRQVTVLPAAHTVPGVGFGVHTPQGLWVYTGDTGPNPALWQALQGQPIAELVIETAFGNDEAHLADISGHLSPQSLARELLQLDGSVSVYITHPKPGEVPAVLSQIRALDSRHRIEPLREGQRFGEALPGAAR